MILLYHSIIPDGSPAERSSAGQALLQAAFRRHIRWLTKKHNIVSLEEYLAGWKRHSFRRDQTIALTFDDGFALTFQCISSFLIETKIPATIFVSTGHLEDGKLLWFSYLKALCFEYIYNEINVNQLVFQLRTPEQRKEAWDRLRMMAKFSGSPNDFCSKLSKVYPLTADVASIYGGMTCEQIKTAYASRILEIGAHTITHPYLDQLPRAKQEKEIVESKRILSEITEGPVRYFAYPGGDYNRDTVELVKAAGYAASFAVIPKKLGPALEHEIGRIGVYSQSLFKLQLKTLGLANWARWLGLQVG